MAAAAVAAEVAAMAVRVDVEDEEDSCMTSFDDLNKLCPVSLQEKKVYRFNDLWEP